MIWRRWAGGLPTGIDRVCLAYLQAFGARSRAVIQYHGYRRILSAERSAWLFGLLESPTGDFRRKLALGLARSLFDRPESGRGLLYLNIGHTGLDQEGLAGWVKESGVRPVYFIHDLIPITHPQFCRAGELNKHRRRMTTVLDTAHGVIGNSRATLDELAAFARDEGLSMPPSITGWLGTDVPAHPSATPAIEPVFVALGTIEARKNHMMLLEIWSRLADSSCGPVPRLLLIGQRGWECAHVFERLEKDERLRGIVVELNDCSDAEIADHIASARALLFPSHAEGFGLPLTEALALGTPVVASDLPVFREIGQGVPELIQAEDADAWLEAVLAYADADNPRRRSQLDRVAKFKPFSWQDHFAAIGPWLAKL